MQGMSSDDENPLLSSDEEGVSTMWRTPRCALLRFLRTVRSCKVSGTKSCERSYGTVALRNACPLHTLYFPLESRLVSRASYISRKKRNVLPIQGAQESSTRIETQTCGATLNQSRIRRGYSKKPGSSNRREISWHRTRQPPACSVSWP